MTRKLRRYSLFSLLAGVVSILLWLITTAPSMAHWDDLAAAKIIVEEAEVQITLTYPTELTAFADDDRNGQLSAPEIANHAIALQTFLEDHIHLRDGQNRLATLDIQPSKMADASMMLAVPNSHTTLQLFYTWSAPIQGLVIDYNLFVSDAPEASCSATILQAGKLTSHVFTPQKTTLALMPNGIGLGGGAWLLPLIGAFVWGAVHSMSPGHGKTLIGAYLVGERATPLHAIFLALTTTITHTLGVIALGLITLFAARYILPEQLYPWLSLISGGIVIVIGLNLFWQRSRRQRPPSRSQPLHSHDHPDHVHPHDPAQSHTDTQGHDHSHPHHHAHDHGPEHSHAPHHSHHHGHTHSESHSHDGHPHSHLPPEAHGTPVTWRNLLMLGLSGGLVPCPAALVLLLGAIALGNPLSGLTLVVAFSLGLASVLTGLGLLLVYAKQLFRKLPTPHLPLMQWLPLVSAIGITAIGAGISTQSILQII